MGQIVRRKRRGRPSNTDRARRTSPASPPSPVDRRRSRRCRNVRYNFDIDDYVDDDEFYEDEDVDIGRREKKLRLLLCEDDSRSNRRVSHAPSCSSSEEEEEEEDDDDDDDCKPSKKRKLDDEGEIEEFTGRKLEEDDAGDDEEGGSDFVCVTASHHQKGVVPLPDKKTLELILDKLQKKDIYGVYAAPVDPDELPDYYEVIKHPMDFATVRKKLAKGSYLTLKEFESDVLLICTNAMQYNAPDTIYYKQASSIQEQAKIRFQRLRANIDQSEIELKAEQKTLPSFSLPKKQLKKPVGRAVQDPVDSETFSGAIVRTGEFPNASAQNPSIGPESGEVPIAENSSLADNNLDKDQELLPGKGFMSKLGRKPSVHDENRRATYNISVQPVTESNSIFSTFEGESKQFIPVGLHADHSYARSLARFAATLGSNAWKVASNTIEQALPEGVKFGRGWVGEYEPISTPVLIPENRTLKEPNFVAHFKITSDVKESIKDPNPPFFSSMKTNPAFSGSKKSMPQVELNHPPPTHIVTKSPISNASDFPSPRPPSKPVSRNGNLASLASFKHPSKVNPTHVGLDCNRMVPTDDNNNNNLARSQQGLSDPVQMMKMLAEKAQHQQNRDQVPGHNGFDFGPKREDSKPQHQQMYSNGSQIGSKRDDSGNVALTAAQAWMSLGGNGGFIKPQLTENTTHHKPQFPTRDHQQPQVSRFPTYQQPVHAFVQQPVRMVIEGQLQNRNVGFPQVGPTDLSRFQLQSSWRGVNPQMQLQSRSKQQESRPPDLNIGYGSIGSPVRQSAGMLVDSQQPDLALQL